MPGSIIKIKNSLERFLFQFFEKWWWKKPKPPLPPNACTCWFATNGPDANSTVTAAIAAMLKVILCTFSIVLLITPIIILHSRRGGIYVICRNKP